MAAGPVALIYLIWGAVCSGLYLAWGMLPAEVPRGFDYLSICICLYAAVMVTEVYLVRLEPRFRARHSLRMAWLAAVVLVFLGGYLFTALTGYRSNLLFGILTITLIFFACILGGWLASHLKRPAEIVAVGVTAGLADMFSVFKGPTKVLSQSIAGYYEGGMQGFPPFVDFVLVKVPMPGQKAFMPLFGITDWILLAFLAAAACKFKLNDNLLGGSRTWDSPKFFLLPAACVGLAAAILLARETRIFLPALPFAVTVYLCFMMVRYPQMRQMKKAEILPMVGVSALLISLMIFL
ncbi:MAG: hypothetical protein HUN04_12670 [Desulfobacter sp.]|nr:MAG: hypothetical protein HUN04_12670 [Desulfobacter sp.]